MVQAEGTSSKYETWLSARVDTRMARMGCLGIAMHGMVWVASR